MAKKNLQAMVPADHADRVRNAVEGMQRIHGAKYTLTRFIIDATEAHCRDLEAAHHGGEPWPAAGEGGLPRGARIAQTPPSDSSRITPNENLGDAP